MRPADCIRAGSPWALAALGLALAAAGNAAEKVLEERLGTLPQPILFPRSSRDGLHYACVTRQGGPTFHLRGPLEYLAIRDDVLYRVKHLPREGP